MIEAALMAIALSTTVAIIFTMERCIYAIKHWILPRYRHRINSSMESLVPQ